MPDDFGQGPLTEAVFYILLALHKPMHGYGIMQFVRELSKGRVNLGPGTLYGAINTLLEKGWIEVPNYTTDDRKKEYVITPNGRRSVQGEMHRLRELIDNGRKVLGGEDGEA